MLHYVFTWSRGVHYDLSEQESFNHWSNNTVINKKMGTRLYADVKLCGHGNKVNHGTKLGSPPLFVTLGESCHLSELHFLL